MADQRKADHLYQRLQAGVLDLETAAGAPFYDADMIDTVSQSYRDSLHRLMKLRAECQELLSDQDLQASVRGSIVCQAAYVPDVPCVTFAAQAMSVLERGQGLFYQLLTSIMSSNHVGQKLREDYLTWREFEYRRDEFAELQRGLAWELETIRQMVASKCPARGDDLESYVRELWERKPDSETHEQFGKRMAGRISNAQWADYKSHPKTRPTKNTCARYWAGKSREWAKTRNSNANKA